MATIIAYLEIIARKKLIIFASEQRGKSSIIINSADFLKSIPDMLGNSGLVNMEEFADFILAVPFEVVENETFLLPGS